MPREDFNDEDHVAVQQWIDEQRQDIVLYLQRQPDMFGELGEVPAWHIPPILSLWVVESCDKPGWIGHWVIAGDVPTDYVPADDIDGEQHPQGALRLIAHRWKGIAEAWLRGEKAENFEIGGKNPNVELAPLLLKRANFLLDLSKDDTYWAGVLPPGES